MPNRLDYLRTVAADTGSELTLTAEHITVHLRTPFAGMWFVDAVDGVPDIDGTGTTCDGIPVTFDYPSIVPQQRRGA